MVPDKFNMVDMGGIDLIMMQGEEVPGLYDRLVESITQCTYQCLYNWLFDGVVIPPSYVKMEVNENDEVEINEGITVTSNDVIHIHSIEPGPVDPEIIPLLAEENGVYNVPTGKDGFNPVTVDVPSYTPVINSISITENGTYTAPTGVDGYSPVIVNVSGSGGEVLFYQSKGQNSGSAQYIAGEITIQRSGTYLLYGGGWVDTNGAVIKINNVAIQQTALGGYSYFAYSVSALSQGDVVSYNVGGSGRLAATVIIAFLHD